jgi:hypothetical protein
MKNASKLTAFALIAMIAGSGAAMAQPQPYRAPAAQGPHQTQGPIAERREDNFVERLNDRVADLRDRLSYGNDHRKLSRSEYKRLSRDLNQVSVDIRNQSRGIRALDRHDYERLNDRLDRLAARIHFERNDGNRH